MKKLLFTLSIFLCVFFSFAQDSSFGRVPKAERREASVIAKAQNVANTSEALQILKDASEHSWAGAALWFNLGNVLMSSSNSNEAVEAYRKALQFEPSFFAARKNLAFALEASGKTDESFAEMKNALALSGGSDVDILRRMIARKSALGDFSSALTLCNQALIYDTENDSLSFAKALFLFELENFVECEKLCSEILSKDSSRADVLRLLGKSRAKRGDYRAAISPFEIVKKSGKGLPSDFAFLGDLFFRLKLYKFAIENYRLADKKDFAEKAVLALLYSGDALAVLEISKTFSSPFKYKLEALANAELGKFEESATAFKKYFESNPSDFYCALKAGDVALSLEKFSEADEYFSRALLDSNYKIQSYYGLARSSLARGDYRSALSYVRKIAKINPSSETTEYVKRLEKYVSEME